MKKAALLLSVTGYAWYMVFAFNAHNSYPDLGNAILKLVLICLLPTLLGNLITGRILTVNPTMFKLLSLNLLYYLLYTLLFFLSANFINGWSEVQDLLVFNSFWQLISWSLGTYPLIAAAESGKSPLLTLRSMEISLIVLPAVFLLTYMNFPSLVMLLVIISWFAALSLFLLTGGVNLSSQGRISLPYDIVLIHSLIPFLLALVLFLTAFSAEAFEVLKGVLGILLAFLVYLAKLLDSFFGLPTQNPPAPKTSYAPRIPEEGAALNQSPVIITVFLMVLAALLIIVTVRQLIKMLRKRIALSADISPLLKPSAFNIKGFLQHLLSLIICLYEYILAFFAGIRQGCQKTLQKLRDMIKQHLPPKTSAEAVYRCYHRYLRWAGRFGHPRKKSETPLEYAHRLQEFNTKASASQKEINELTRYYLEACYSKKPAEWEQADKCRDLLNAIKKPNK